jgi:hypothetical protein
MKHLKVYDEYRVTESRLDEQQDLLSYVEPFFQEIKDIDGVEFDWNMDEVSLRLDFTDTLTSQGLTPSMMGLSEFDRYTEASRRLLEFNLLLKKALNKITLDGIYSCEVYIADLTWFRVFFEKMVGHEAD